MNWPHPDLPRLPCPDGKAVADVQSVRVLQAQDPLKHSEQRSELVVPLVASFRFPVQGRGLHELIDEAGVRDQMRVTVFLLLRSGTQR